MIIVIEIQAGDTVATLVNSYEDRQQAENKYHTILAAAAVSNVPIHTAMMMTAEGEYIKCESYKHEIEVEEVEEVGETSEETSEEISEEN